MSVLQGKVVDILALGGVTEIAVGGTDVAYSKAFELKNEKYFGSKLQFTSSGDVNVKVELEQSFDAPATEGVADDNFVIPDNKADSPVAEAITDELVHISNYQPNPTPYARYKFTGLLGNDASTVVSTLKLYEVK